MHAKEEKPNHENRSRNDNDFIIYVLTENVPLVLSWRYITIRLVIYLHGSIHIADT